MNVPHHHHYVPQFHLRRFGHGAGHGLLWAYDKTLDKIVRARVKSTAQEIDYNAVATPSGLNYEIEAMFARLEGETKPIIDRLLALPVGAHWLDPHDRASAVEVALEPGYYAASGMALVQSVDGLGEQAGVIGNTLLIKRGADVIEILTTPYDGSQKARAAMVALGKAIYPRFQSRRRRSARVLAEGERHAGG